MPVSTAANSGTFTVTTPSDREIRMTRLFDAPRALVFEAMTKPEHIKQWWGNLGEGYSVPVCEVDLRSAASGVSSTARRRGRTPCSTASTARSTPPGRVVFTEIFEPYPDTESVVTAVLTEENGKTRLTATVAYPSREVRDMVNGHRHGARRRPQLRPPRRRRPRPGGVVGDHPADGVPAL